MLREATLLLRFSEVGVMISVTSEISATPTYLLTYYLLRIIEFSRALFFFFVEHLWSFIILRKFFAGAMLEHLNIAD